LYILTLDLGTTNVKVGLYDSDLKEIMFYSLSVNYIRNNNFCEFNPEHYWQLCKKGIIEVVNRSKIDPHGIATLCITGQAESLVILDGNNNCLRNGISWMDNRSQKECEILKKSFNNQGYKITGQPEIITTWPVTKMLWIKHNESDFFKKADKYLLLKDFIVYKLTGIILGEYTIYNFSYYFDIVKKKYWNDILDYVGIKTNQLPPLTEPGEAIGTVTKHIAKELGVSEKLEVNIGTLDHFAGMIGTGNIRQGIVNETTGTVLAIATIVSTPLINDYRIPCHYNVIKNTYALLPVCESGGISMEWFKNTFFPDKSYEHLNHEIQNDLDSRSEIIFLPYITGTNSPDYNPNARGVFYGINSTDTGIDFARAVMEGVAFLLQKNIQCLEKLNIKTENIISLGGASKSEVWNQIKANITGKKVLIPDNEEATSLGAAILAGFTCGLFDSLENGIKKNVKIKKVYHPKSYDERYSKMYKKFLKIYEQLTPVFNNRYL